MPAVIAVVTDLIFQSRIAAVARHTGADVRYVTSLDELPDDEGPRLALVDLDAGVDVLQAIRALAAQAPVVAFGPHLDTERRKAARAAGATRVLAKSKFVQELPTLLSAG
ncbi:MAG TPA: hypothetical protein VFB58_07160 [Chloroflexota bacterium]|nr:hypothetical protein [Chloroflexota bacterium]